MTGGWIPRRATGPIPGSRGRKTMRGSSSTVCAGGLFCSQRLLGLVLVRRVLSFDNMPAFIHGRWSVERETAPGKPTARTTSGLIGLMSGHCCLHEAYDVVCEGRIVRRIMLLHSLQSVDRHAVRARPTGGGCHEQGTP